MVLSTDLQDSPSNTAVLTRSGLATPFTSPSFTPPANSLVVASVAAGWSGATQAVISLSDSGSHSWSNPIKATGTSSNGGTASIFTSYFATSPGSITVSAAYSGFSSGSGGEYMSIWVLMGAKASQAGAGTASKLTTTGLDGTFPITTTKQGSWVFGISDDSTNAATWTPAAGVSNDPQYNDATDSITAVAWYSTTIPSPGAWTMGGTWAANGSSNHTTQQCALEILPADDLPLRPVIMFTQAVRSSLL